MPPQLIHQKIPLSASPASSLSCTLFRPLAPTSGIPLVVFINGLLTKSCEWEPIILSLSALPNPPFILSYDRFNVAPSDALPADRDTNDISTAARDLGALLEKVYSLLELSQNGTSLVLVGLSIGCCIARLFVKDYATRATSNRGYRVAGVMLLDSYISNTDFTSLFPPVSADEPEALSRTRSIIIKRFHPSVGNPEHLDRSTAQELLPSASDPKFPGNPPELVVISHDPEYNAEDMAFRLNIDKECYLRYVQSAWDEYNAGLVQLSPKGRHVRAERSGHFIHRDRQDLVLEEIEAILETIPQ